MTDLTEQSLKTFSSSATAEQLKTIKIARTFMLYIPTADSFKELSVHLKRTESSCADEAFRDFILKHARTDSDISLTVVEVAENVASPAGASTEDCCEVNGCKKPSVGKAEYLPKEKVFALCVAHLKEYTRTYPTRKNWKVLKNE